MTFGVVDDRDPCSQSPIRPLVVLAGQPKGRVFVEIPDALEHPDRERHVRREQNVSVDQRLGVGPWIGERDDRQHETLPFRLDPAREDRVPDRSDALRDRLQPVGPDPAIVMGGCDERRSHAFQSSVRPRGDAGLLRSHMRDREARAGQSIDPGVDQGRAALIHDDDFGRPHGSRSDRVEAPFHQLAADGRDDDRDIRGDRSLTHPLAKSPRVRGTRRRDPPRPRLGRDRPRAPRQARTWPVRRCSTRAPAEPPSSR